MSESVGGWGGAGELNEEQRAVLENEKSWRKHFRTKGESIAALGMSGTHYYLMLRDVLEAPAAELEEPELVRRLRRLRDRRVIERGGTSTD